MFQTPEMSVGRYLEKIKSEQAVVESVAVLINAERGFFIPYCGLSSTFARFTRGHELHGGKNYRVTPKYERP